MTTRLNAGSASDTGRVRSINQDSKLLLDRLRFYAVADGMGGHQGGEVASAMAVETLESIVGQPSVEALVGAVEEANRTIYERASNDRDLHGMGTTVCAIAVVEAEDDDEEIAWINVGDSRIYLFRDDQLTQLSTDHSLVEDLRRDGQITAEEAAVHPQRNIVTRALGIAGDVDVDSRTLIAFTGDRFVLSSDGLFNELTSEQISATLRRLADPSEAAQELVRQANEHGGRDNITVVVVDVTDDGGRLAAANLAAEEDRARAAERAETDEDPSTQEIPVVTGAATSPAGAATSMAGFESVPSEAPEDEPQDDDIMSFGRSSDNVYEDLDKVKRRHLTWRVFAFLLAIGLVVAAAFGAVGFYAKRTYFVDYSGDQVAIYQGQPGGLLVFDPEVKTLTGVKRSTLTEAEDQTVKRQQSFGSLVDATSFANNLRTRVEQRATTTTTSSTSTTIATTTTTPATTTPAPTTAAP